MSGLGLNSFQFAIGRKRIDITKDTLHEKVNENYILSFDSELKLIKTKDLNDKTWFLIGYAFQTDDNLPSPEKQITLTNTNSIPEITKDWGGRWLLINNDIKIYLDAGGSLGCFYSQLDGEVWISSSVAILKDLQNTSLKQAPRIQHSKGMDFYPGPLTKYKNIFRLLPGQILHVNDDDISIKFTPSLERMHFENDEEAYEFIQTRLTTYLKNIYKAEKDLWLPLTAGFDSRLILSAVHKANIEVTIYTFDKPFYLISGADKRIPKILANKLEYEYKYIKREGFSEDRMNTFDYHTAEMIPGIDRTYYAYNQFRSIPDSAFILRGGMFEVGRCFYYELLDSNVQNAKDSILKSFNFDKNHKNSFAHFDSINNWINWIEKYPIDEIDWRDRFYLEQRVGSWLSSIEQALDLTGLRRVHVANCYKILSAFASFPEKIKAEGTNYKALINNMSPNLLNIPINPSDSYFRRGIAKAIRTLK